MPKVRIREGLFGLLLALAARDHRSPEEELKEALQEYIKA